MRYSIIYSYDGRFSRISEQYNLKADSKEQAEEKFREKINGPVYKNLTIDLIATLGQ
jgi:hypothetical protein